jgi:hypothetical protein
MIGLSLLMLASGPLQAAPDDPLLPALSGQLQCYTPDEVRKTCGAMAWYRPDGDGRYVNRAEVPLTPDGSVTMTTSTQVRIVSGAECGTPRAEEIANAEVKARGRVVPADRAAPVLAQITEAMASLLGREFCTRYEQRGDGLSAEVSIDGIRRPDLDRRVIWVNASDGYRVAQ